MAFVIKHGSQHLEVQERLVKIGARSLFVRVRGSGPAVVLSSGADTAGVGGWEPVEQQLAQFATVVSYDRAGTGRSDSPLSSASAADMVADLHELLASLHISPPFMLVGRSFGALPVQLYACEYPLDVKGLVLIDPTPDLMLTNYYAPTSKTSQRLSTQSAHLERARMAESCAQVRSAIEKRRMPNVPVVVLTAAVRTEMGAAASIVGDSVLMAHQHMAARVPDGRLIVAERSSHATMVSDEPELIVKTIQSLIAV